MALSVQDLQVNYAGEMGDGYYSYPLAEGLVEALGGECVLLDVTDDPELLEQATMLVANEYHLMHASEEVGLETVYEHLCQDVYTPNARTFALVHNGSVVATVRLVIGSEGSLLNGRVREPLEAMDFFHPQSRTLWPHLDPENPLNFGKRLSSRNAAELGRFVISSEYRKSMYAITQSLYEASSSYARSKGCMFLYSIMSQRPNVPKILERSGIPTVKLDGYTANEDIVRGMERSYPNYWTHHPAVYYYPDFYPYKG